MSPRGVAIPAANEQLFAAAERVLLRDGADRLTSRAITNEAGVAKGLLHNHFGDLDRFLIELISNRAQAAAAEISGLPARAGARTVADNLTEASMSLLRSHAFALVGVAHSRPALMARLHEARSGRPYAVLDNVERAFATYLDAEQQAGRIEAETDTETLALVLVGTLHHLFITGRTHDSRLQRRICSVVASVISAAAEASSTSGRRCW